MIQYLVILLDDTSVAFCHTDNPMVKPQLMPLEVLKEAIVFGMKENLMIQYSLPSYALPKEYWDVMESIDNVKIVSSSAFSLDEPFRFSDSDIEVFTSIPKQLHGRNIIIRLPFKTVLEQKNQIAALLGDNVRVNICFTDVDSFSDSQIKDYDHFLHEIGEELINHIRQGRFPQLNLLTDRLTLTSMRNCDAGVKSLTLAPNGRFYLCPAFYYDEQRHVDNGMSASVPEYEYSVGDLLNGININNPQLLRLDHAPLCRICDAYQCRRCVWMNKQLTWDINTPSHQQCIMAHVERNVSRDLLTKINQSNEIGFKTEAHIDEIDYLDPFDSIKR